MPHLDSLAGRIKFGLQISGRQNQIGALMSTGAAAPAIRPPNITPQRNLIATSDLEVLRRRRRRRRGGILPQIQLPNILRQGARPAQITPSRNILA